MAATCWSLAVVLALLAGLGTWYATDLRYDETPVLIGSTEAVAKSSAENEGFSFDVGRRTFSENAVAGTIISTDPGPGQKILPGDTISAVVSRGPDRVSIPDNNLTGLRISQAKAELAKLDLVLGERKPVYDEKIAKDLIVRADGVTSEDELRRGDAVNVVVSRGRQPIAVKSYIGEPLSAATNGLRAAGFKPSYTREWNDTVPSGLVITQNPGSGKAFRNDTIAMTVSKGPEMIAIPDVRGMKKSDARAALRPPGSRSTGCTCRWPATTSSDARCRAPARRPSAATPSRSRPSESLTHLNHSPI